MYEYNYCILKKMTKEELINLVEQYQNIILEMIIKYNNE